MTKESYNCLRNLRRHQWISRMREIRTSGFMRGAGSWIRHELCLYSPGFFSTFAAQAMSDVLILRGVQGYGI